MTTSVTNLLYTHNTTSFSSGMITSGIPTRTTPTLTPTTLRNIEESFMDLQTLPPSEHQRQAGFVPPVVNMSLLSQNSDSNNSFDSDYSSKQDEPQWLETCMQNTSSTASSSSGSTSSGKTRAGGRRSNKQERLSPEEEERRNVRRERNKLAAARCRKRRLDHTNCLLVETDGLEEKRQSLQNEIQVLTHQKEELEFLLEAHRANCKKTSGQGNSHKVPITSASTAIKHTSSPSKVIVRPTSLALSSSYSNVTIKKEPSLSSVLSPSNFDWLMEGGTGLTPLGAGLTPLVGGSGGLTPLISSCSGQQRSSSSDLSSPDTMNPPKLVSL